MGEEKQTIMHSPTPGADHQKGEQLDVNLIGDSNPGDNQTEVHGDSEPCLRPVSDALHEWVDNETKSAAIPSVPGSRTVEETNIQREKLKNPRPECDAVVRQEQKNARNVLENQIDDSSKDRYATTGKRASLGAL